MDVALIPPLTISILRIFIYIDILVTITYSYCCLVHISLYGLYSVKLGWSEECAAGSFWSISGRRTRVTGRKEVEKS
jgi:hypothetical protein